MKVRQSLTIKYQEINGLVYPIVDNKKASNGGFPNQQAASEWVVEKGKKFGFHPVFNGNGLVVQLDELIYNRKK